MNEDLQILREKRSNVEKRINDRIKRISEMVNSFSKEGDTIEIIANHQYKLVVTDNDILVIKDNGSVFFRDLKLSNDYQLIKLILERQKEILSKFIEFNQRMIKMGKNICDRYIQN